MAQCSAAARAASCNAAASSAEAAGANVAPLLSLRNQLSIALLPITAATCCFASLQVREHRRVDIPDSAGCAANFSSYGGPHTLGGAVPDVMFQHAVDYYIGSG